MTGGALFTNSPKQTKPGRAMLVLAGLVVIAAIVFLTISVQREIRLLGSAQSDNVQWSLAQTEVEYLEYIRELDGAPIDLEQLKRRFDVFFSRINTIQSASVFAELRADADSQGKLDEISDFLNNSAAIIDAGDAEILARQDTLRALAQDTRMTVRLLSKSGLSLFAQSSDSQRILVARTMTQLAVALAVLIGALFVGVVFLNQLNARLAGREREQSQIASRMNTVISTSLDAVIVSDDHGRILEFNPAAEIIFGHNAEDVLGKDIGDIIVPDHMRDAHHAGMERMNRSGERRVVGKGRVQLEGKRANNEIFPVELALQSATTDDGDIFIAFLRDISKRVANEQELVEARDKALASEKLKTDFLSTMSHEIRTPLNGLLGNMNLLRDTRLSKEQDRYLGYMESSGRLLMSHISDVLDITRYDAGKLDTRSEPVNISALLEDIIDNQSSTAADNETSLDWGWDGTPMHWIVSDHDRLQHIMMNLIGNAVKFTRRGKVSVTARIEHDAGHNQLVLDVTDTGEGIDEDLVGQVFDDFVIGNTKRNREAGGTGLGLGIAKRFVQALGGEIMVKSVPGKGSTFIVTLPVVEAEPLPDDATHVLPAATDRKLRVLLVEDNEVNCVVARSMIEADGHSVVEAHDGQEGAELASAQAFDIIFMDINMPIMDGRAATRHIRSSGGASSDAPIVALTANAMANEQADLLSDGMNAILTKPLSRDALRAALAHHTRASSGRRTTPFVDPTHRAETRHALGEQAYSRLTARFAQEVEDMIEWLGADHGRDFLEVASRSHKVAGSAAVFGATALREALKTIEIAAKTGDSATLEHEVGTLSGIWSETKPELL
jgi:PAS domain S-box-containing protein